MDIVLIRSKVAEVEAERALLPRPMPTAKFPTPQPPGCACKFFRHVYGLTPHPLSCRACPFFEIARTGSAARLSCRNTITISYKAVKPQELVERLKDADQFTIFMCIVYMWEFKKNFPREAGDLRRHELPFEHLKTKVLNIYGTEMQTELMVGIFWPLPIYKLHHANSQTKPPSRH